MSPIFGRTRLLGFGLLAITFLVGALAGTAIDRVTRNDAAAAESREDRQDNGDRGRQYIIDRVDMSDVQRTAIDSILERRVRRMRAVWREVEPQLDAITDSARAEIMEVLTPEQEAEYETLLEKRRRSRRGDGEDGDSTAGKQQGHIPWELRRRG